MTKSAEYYMGLPYTIELHQGTEEGWFTRVKELSGCMSQGDTAEDALANIREVLPLWIETALESGYEIPEPRAEEEYSGKFVVRVPRSLHRELVQGADGEGVSLNQFINVILSKAMGQTLQVQSVGAQDDPSWPGLKSSMWHVLVAAGQSVDAGQVDESLFANWADHMIGQVEAALAGGYERDALSYLISLDNALAAGVSRSPALHAFRRIVRLLHQQITVNHGPQQRIVGLVQARNRAYAATFMQEEPAIYAPLGGTEAPEQHAWAAPVGLFRKP